VSVIALSKQKKDATDRTMLRIPELL